jgi:peptide/nickel transport system permease protein
MRDTRVVRAEVMALREKEFIEAARAIGVGRLRIIARHVLPNTVSSPRPGWRAPYPP